MRQRFGPAFRYAALLVLVVARPAAAQAPGTVALPDTVGSFEFRDRRGDPARPLRVWYYRPAGAVRPTRVVFLLHGSTRTGRQAQELGAPFARAENVILIAPEFSTEHYPDVAYDFGGMAGADGTLRPDSVWTLSIVEHLFDAVRQAVGGVDSTYDIVGHSAGGQFVHRLVLFMPSARYRRAVVSSPGRYAFPSLEVPFPYGLRSSSADSATRNRAFGRDVVLVLGEKDVADQARLWEPETMAQGRNRLARGLRFYASAVEEATASGTPFAWRLQIVPGVDHDPPRMVRAALQLLRD